MRWVVLLTAFTALWYSAEPANAWRLDPTYSAIASEVARSAVTVYCAEGTEWQPYGTSLGKGAPGIVWLAPATCNRLASFDSPWPFCDFWRYCPAYLDAALGIHTLSHEAWHAAGIADERDTDCQALTTVGLVAQRLGASTEYATYLAYDERLRYHGWRDATYYKRDCYSSP